MNELERIEPLPLAERQEPQDLLAMAVKQGASVDTLERLMVVRKELRAEQAEAEFNAAMAAFQNECPLILKTVAGHDNRYKYAPLDQIVRTVTPFLAKHGFSHQEDGVVTEGWVEALVTVTHRGGHSVTKKFKVPAESKAGCSPQQKYGAAMTYATRYAFCAAFGIRTAERDTDAAPEAGSSVTELNKKLWELLAPVRGEANNWRIARQWLVDECNFDPSAKVADMDAGQLQTLIQRVGERLKELGKSK